jgi:hypothetical protein
VKILTFSFITLLLNLFLGLFCWAEEAVVNLPKHTNKIYAIAVEPQQRDGLHVYSLKIFFDKNDKHKTIGMVRPLDGKLMDLKLHDVDKDGIDELVVMMADQTTMATHVHFDIFEFDGKHISLVKNFTQVAQLYELFQAATP